MEKNIEPKEAYLALTAILDSIDAIVYVADMHTHEIIFMNQYGRLTWSNPEGRRRCWEVLQAGQTGPCAFCSNDKLLDQNGNPTGVYVWEFRNTVNQHWYHCRDQAIKWIDGRIVRMEIATDITDIKQVHEELKTAKEKAERLSRTDELTGIKNRRATFEEGAAVFSLAKRYQHSVSIIMLDVDHFKQFNDYYGHATGDQLLTDLARNIEVNIRESDIFGRIGGEEFALILPETELAEAAIFAERLRAIVATLVVEGREGIQSNVSSSFGVAACTAEQQGFEQVLSNADKALYLAKKKGRNRVECFLSCHAADPD